MIGIADNCFDTDGYFVDDALLICFVVPNFDSFGIDTIKFKL